MATETVEVAGHIVDSLILPKILDLIVDADVDYTITSVEIGRTNLDPSRAVIELVHDDEAVIDALCERLEVHGASRVGDADAEVVAADVDGVLPAGFHSTTNLATDVRVGGRWVPVENPEMDCGLVVLDGGDGPRVRTVPMHRVRSGDRIVVGHGGVRVRPVERDRETRAFEFMNSDVSSEKPKALLVEQVAERMRAARDRGGRILAVCGPAVVHTGGGPALAGMVRAGWVDVLFAGNGFATHDMEANVHGTSLGISLTSGQGTEGGHSNHLRLINEVRRFGSIRAAVEAGFVTGGVMHDCVRTGVPFVLGGSVRDDGPLPDTIADVVVAADAMRAHAGGVAVALMLASTLHAIATGNILPGVVETFCVDINQAVVTKLADRGSHQALGVVTDVGPFLHDLAVALDAGGAGGGAGG
jgi:lysine-ketoglutarate reductase/saccharopine dehydrogenase-like protein (TIGR00300 family)